MPKSRRGTNEPQDHDHLLPKLWWIYRPPEIRQESHPLIMTIRGLLARPTADSYIRTHLKSETKRFESILGVVTAFIRDGCKNGGATRGGEPPVVAAFLARRLRWPLRTHLSGLRPPRRGGCDGRRVYSVLTRLRVGVRYEPWILAKDNLLGIERWGVQRMLLPP